MTGDDDLGIARREPVEPAGFELQTREALDVPGPV
jgi:hypothetical protein